jgi:hypothetical protein
LDGFLKERQNGFLEVGTVYMSVEILIVCKTLDMNRCIFVCGKDLFKFIGMFD